MARNWVFTLNNWEVEDLKKIEELYEDGKIMYYVVGFEEAPTTGTKHLQGYFEWNNSKTMSSLKSKWPNIHLEKRMGTAKQAADYCKKSEKFQEAGKISTSRQGERSDLKDLADAICDGSTDYDLALAMPVMLIKFPKGIDRLRAALLQDRTEKPKVFWYYGPTGSGKTKEAFGDGKGKYMKDETQWWDGYNGTDDVIIDDFDGRWPFRSLLRLLDRYPYQGQYKGGYTKIAASRIYITCDRRPEEIYGDERELGQLLRRIDEIKEFRKH